METYDSDADAPFASAGPGSAQLSQNLLVQPAAAAPGQYCSLSNLHRQAGIDATLLASGRQCRHSPDASATFTGPCSDASDLTSSHPLDLPMHPYKRIKLGSAQPAQLTAGCHASMQHAPDPNLTTWSPVAEAFAQQPGRQGLPSAGRGSDSDPPRGVLFPASLSPPSAAQVDPEQHSWQAADNGSAPPYVPCAVPGLTTVQELVKAQQETQLAEALHCQQNMLVGGYEMDHLGGLQLPHGKYTRMISMKIVFAQRWRHDAQSATVAAAAPLSLKQLLLDPAVQLECEQALSGNGVLQQDAVQLASQSRAPTASAKLPIRFKLAEVKNAMRKAELSAPEMSSTSCGNHTLTASDVKHTAWQLEQLSNTPVLNNPWVEHYVDRVNIQFDESYWSMLENLSAVA